MASVSTPGWIQDALEYFGLIEGGASWTQLVSEWHAFEVLLGHPDGQHWLPAKERPEEIKIWTKNARDYEKLPKIQSVAQYATTWKQWWTALQPASRMRYNVSNWPLLRDGPTNLSEWGLLRRGGCNGFFLVVMSLAWWVWAARNEGEGEDEALQAVDDVSWVCRALMSASEPQSAAAAPTEKRSGSAPDSPSPKRARIG
ncbi:hypothetical protein C2E23DRAFT_733574 [Lenzites betulinus]|nr:hypothetical protein C2E23DRAFT_733574 [Lenzites betulinus]